MTDEVAKERADALREVRQLQADLSKWETEEKMFLDQLLDLLAWLIGVGQGAISPADRLRWPLVDLWRHEETQRLALTDPILFNLARNQLAVDFSDDPGSFATSDQHSDFISRLLLADRPKPGKGKGAAKAGIKEVAQLMFHLHRAFNFWDLPTRRIQELHDHSWNSHTAHAFSVALSDKLNEHPQLERLPDAVPSPEAIRRLLKA